MIAHIVTANNGARVYVEARDEYLSPEQARADAHKLLELAERAELSTLAA